MTTPHRHPDPLPDDLEPSLRELDASLADALAPGPVSPALIEATYRRSVRVLNAAPGASALNATGPASGPTSAPNRMSAAGGWSVWVGRAGMVAAAAVLFTIGARLLMQPAPMTDTSIETIQVTLMPIWEDADRYDAEVAEVDAMFAYSSLSYDDLDQELSDLAQVIGLAWNR